MDDSQLQVSVRLANQKLQFTGISETNIDRPIVFDFLPPAGDGQGFRGLELLIMSFAGCVSTAITFLLRKAGKDVSGLKLETSGTTVPQPLSLQRINFSVTLESSDADIDDLRKAIAIAGDISPVWISIRNNVEVIVDKTEITRV